MALVTCLSVLLGLILLVCLWPLPDVFDAEGAPERGSLVEDKVSGASSSNSVFFTCRTGHLWPIVCGALLMMTLVVTRPCRGYGSVPGPSQTVQRAEFWEVILALQAADGIHLGVDNLGGGGRADAQLAAALDKCSPKASSTTMSSRMVSACSGRSGGDQEKPSTGRSHTRRSPVSKLIVPPRPPPSTPAVALVEDEPSNSTAKRRKVQVDPIVRNWFLERLCPVLFDGVNQNTPYRWKRSSPRAAHLGRKTLLSPADVTRLSEQILRVTDVLCLSGLTIRGLVLDWLDAEGHDVRPGREWVRRLLRGMRLSFKKPARCVKELHSPVQQHANTHRLFTKLCWLTDKHAASADRVVNIDETSCRLLPVHQIGWGHRAAGQHRGGHDIHGRRKHGPWPAGHAGAALQAGKTDAVLPEQEHSPRHVRERLGHHDDAPAARLVFVACAPTLAQNSARPLKRPTSCTPMSCTPMARCSRDRSSQSPLPKTPWTGPWQKHVQLGAVHRTAPENGAGPR